MTLETVVLGGALAVAAVVGLTAVALWRGRRAGDKARGAWAATQERGALPPSLHPKIDPVRCIGSGTCVEVCPEKDVLAVIDGKARLVNPTSCIGHGECLRACPVDAIELVIGSERRGVDIPLVDARFQTAVPGLFIVGELGGMGLIANAMTQALQCVAALRRELPPRMDGAHQVVVVGAGPAGIAATLALMEAKVDSVTVDQESLGGTVLHFPRQKLVMTRPVTLPLYGKVRVSDVRKEALLEIWRDVVAKTGLTVREGVRVDGLSRGEDGVFTLRTSAGELRAQRVILALGRRGSPRKLGVPGEDTGKVAYRLVDPEQYAGRRVLVVGGGDAGVEAAVSCGEAGATVHLAHRRDVFDRIKPKNQARLDEAVAAGRVTLLLNARPVAIHEDRVDLEVAGVPRALENDYVLVFAGGVLPTAFLEAAGVQVRTFTGQAFAPAN